MKPSQRQKFLLWYVPLLIAFLCYAFYLMTLSHIPYKLGFSHLFNSQKVISITSPDIYEQNNAAILLEVAPGDEVAGRARIRNLTDHNANIDIFPLDAIKNFTPKESGFKLLSRVAELNEVGAWIKLPKSQLTISKNKEEFLDFVVAVPLGTPLGDYAGGIAVEEADDTNGEAKAGQVIVKQRYALRVYLKVTDTPNKVMYRTWEERMKLHNKLFLLHTSIILTNLLVLTALFAVFYPKKNKK